MCLHNSHKANHRDSTGTFRIIQKCNQQTKSGIKEVIKITPKNNSINNIIPVKEKFVK